MKPPTTEQERAQIRAIAGGASSCSVTRLPWSQRLVYNRDGDLRALPVNVVEILSNDPAWAGVLAYDELRQMLTTRKAPPWDAPDRPRAPRVGLWENDDTTRLANWLARHYELGVDARATYSGARIVGLRESYHPVQDWLAGAAWDGLCRVGGSSPGPRPGREPTTATESRPSWLSRYFGVADTPYARFVGRAYLVSAVARAYEPGCKVDTCLVLEGPQGLRKSSGSRALFGPQWFSDTPLDLDSKDRFGSLRRWGVELPELSSTKHAQIDRVKAFITSPRDDYRPPYAAVDVEVPRSNVFIGTVNPGCLGYLRDETGERRWWPVSCRAMVDGTIDIAGIERDREALWAEAREYYLAGERWWPVSPEEHALCGDEQAARRMLDAWEPIIADYLNGQPPGKQLSIAWVLEWAIKLDKARMDIVAQSRCGRALSLAGWTQIRRARVPGGREWLYQRRSEVEAPAET